MLLAVDAAIHDLSIFAPASPDGRSIVDLAVLSVAVGGLIFLIVEGVLLYSIWRFRARRDDSQEPAQVYGSQPIEIAWTAAPTMIVFFLMLVTTRTLWEVNPTPPTPSPNEKGLFVTAIGRQWWWEYRYESFDGRKLDFIAANELHIPTDPDGKAPPVYLRLESADVCHSFWVPRLAGKMDLIPGKTNALTLRADEPGLFLGQCAEFCGTQHANMLIRVVAEPVEEFNQWLEHQRQPATESSAAATIRGKAVFLAHSCVNCHRIRGTTARGNYAPDLTHLMSRDTLASGMLANDEPNLLAWVRNPQSIKQGCLMPPFGLSEEENQQIVNYLMTLH
jgi:cytochrome c oxidase subunit 2